MRPRLVRLRIALSLLANTVIIHQMQQAPLAPSEQQFFEGAAKRERGGKGEDTDEVKKLVFVRGVGKGNEEDGEGQAAAPPHKRPRR